MRCGPDTCRSVLSTLPAPGAAPAPQGPHRLMDLGPGYAGPLLPAGCVSPGKARGPTSCKVFRLCPSSWEHLCSLIWLIRFLSPVVREHPAFPWPPVPLRWICPQEPPPKQHLLCGHPERWGGARGVTVPRPADTVTGSAVARAWQPGHTPPEPQQPHSPVTKCQAGAGCLTPPHTSHRSVLLQRSKSSGKRRVSKTVQLCVLS